MKTLSDVFASWIEYFDKNGDPDNRLPMFRRLQALTDGVYFTKSTLDKMSKVIDTLNESKPDVKRIKEWFKNEYISRQT